MKPRTFTSAEPETPTPGRAGASTTIIAILLLLVKRAASEEATRRRLTASKITSKLLPDADLAMAFVCSPASNHAQNQYLPICLSQGRNDMVRINSCDLERGQVRTVRDPSSVLRL
jgi:hypothetical protein